MREAIPLVVEDVSRFSRALRAALPTDASHQTTLNAVARAAGYANFQHLRAATGAAGAEAPPDLRAVRRAAARFDRDGRLTGWPAQRGLRLLCLWPLWARLPAGAEMDEIEVSALLHGMMTMRDAAQARREMVGEGMLSRERDGTGYRRVERRPDPTQRRLIRAVADLSRGTAPP
ncbi:DUF2087 domain-containing protein [Jannaschia sp. Os4]|uniref:DUF2087 domain-containing protein n=1 Tax=Jannaschia sp. Os4 TaxID=2807617 RepID=UPI00193A6D95|nr:DUF2087 domain-containing protein [Jannaschia sp. Os4]MBM2576827.1 DUF2087 domain-containing protein [Jannaschia sp. Os4]